MAKRVSRSQNSNFTRFLKYLEHQKWYLATSNMAKRVVIEKSHHAWACVIGISHNSVTSHTQISDLSEGLIYRFIAKTEVVIGSSYGSNIVSIATAPLIGQFTVM